MKYMIMTFGDTSGLEGKSPEWIKEMIEFMQRIDVELTESGELVFQQGLADPSQARTVRAQKGVPVASAPSGSTPTRCPASLPSRSSGAAPTT
jgi:hypothetical protein